MPATTGLAAPAAHAHPVGLHVLLFTREPPVRIGTLDPGRDHDVRTALTLNNNRTFFMGYQFAVFDYATQSLGGAVTSQRFELATP
jgi:hypothetical protein